MAKPFKVDFIGIGPAKAGSTWLGHMLDAHPAICMSEPKEVHFFNDSLSFNRSYDKVHYPLGIHWYAQHFKHCEPGKLKGEVTPRYIIDPVVPGRLYQYNPDLKLIVSLRDPCERIISHYHSARDYHKSETRSISQAIREEPEYIEACMYYKNISRFLPFFPLDCFFFLDMKRVKIEPVTAVAELYSFLGVDPSFVPNRILEKSNPARTTRSVGFRKFSGAIHRTLVAWGFSPLIRILKSWGLGQWLNKLNSAPVEKVTLSPSDRTYIHQKIAEDVSSLGKLLNQDFSDWLK